MTMVDKLVTMRNTFAFSHVWSSADKYRQKKLEKDEAEFDNAFYERFEGAWNEDFHALQYDNSSQCKLHTN